MGLGFAWTEPLVSRGTVEGNEPRSMEENGEERGGDELDSEAVSSTVVSVSVVKSE
jgi:hypothetical protein